MSQPPKRGTSFPSFSARPRAKTRFWVVRIWTVLCWVVLHLLAGYWAKDLLASDPVLRIKRPASDGLVIAEVNLTPAFQACGVTPGDWRGLRGYLETGTPVPVQFIPAVDFDAQSNFVGTLIVNLPHANVQRIRFRFEKPSELASAWDGSVAAGNVRIRCDLEHQAGFPVEFVFSESGTTFRVSRWADRVHDRQLGSFLLTADPHPEVTKLSEGPLCTVIRIRARYGASQGNPPPGEPFAVYDWLYFHDRPLILVQAVAVQNPVHPWNEHHFLELQFNQKELPRWTVADPIENGSFANTQQSYRGAQWGFLSNDSHALGMLAAGTVLIYDAPGDDGNYIQAWGDRAWQTWDTPLLKKSALIWLGPAKKAVSELASFSQAWPRREEVVATTWELSDRLAELRAKYPELPIAERQQVWWKLAAEELEKQGQVKEALVVSKGETPSRWSVISAGELGLILERTEDGLKVLGLYDIPQGRLLASSESAPLFELILQDTFHPDNPPRRLRADKGWEAVTMERKDVITCVWKSPCELPGAPLELAAVIKPDAATSSLIWEFSTRRVPPPWSVRQVIFPQLAIADLGPQGCVLYPQGCGIVARDPWSQNFQYQGRYPSGWTTMQFLAAYEPNLKTGLYVGLHDPFASTKELTVGTIPDVRLLRLAYEHPAPNMGKPENGFTLSGQAVWRLLRGDWYDASQIYRDWVVREARWYPQLGANGREDTPLWMRELPLWALYGGPTDQCAEQTIRFAEYFGVPCGVHWYNWHMNPFDNDYPHYFPTKPEFLPGVETLRKAGVHVMPYINGRLWDTRDKGLEDWQFTQRALPAATKNEKNEPFIETYGSKESDGSSVRLAVMCPTTELWQSTVREIVLRLFREFKVDAVYIDQIAAAAPTLCCDPTHGHPLGGGHWWTEGYWQLLDKIRREKPVDCMLTTECNGEPYIRWMDGYLTWHWQYDGQVPAFPAVYGGAIQMFGRSYGGGPTRDLALRMRAAQQLVFGEQLGWISPTVINEKENAEFLKQLAQLRWLLREYFYAGRMLRPPQSDRPLPTVKADWQWGGIRWVTTDAVLTGCWWQPGKCRAVVIAVNVSDQPVETTLIADLAPAFSSDRSFQSKPVGTTPAVTMEASPTGVRIPMTIPARVAWAWEVTSPETPHRSQ
jgi:hypothetical protein